jgi:hypothetical protein
MKSIARPLAVLAGPIAKPFDPVGSPSPAVREGRTPVSPATAGNRALP